ncbi:DUF3088 family protein [Vibrio penaeicida]|uniref:DUF3088 family protein n=1 Tax=Vibrio penaeicida TaxID=104609 RepID=UPI0027359F61|nr:DUF3088 family protein [Vibrio penaeicida]MDP2572638.1 DUF3088 family protein [Vibrio penaeicida]
MKPILFVLKMPFQDEGESWICSHCALIEGAIQVNQRWEDHIDIRRIDFPKPRREVVELIGEDKQWLPVLILEDNVTLTDPIEIINYLASTFGGAKVHP